jgi:CheY-like chemotaxis protein
MQYDKCSIMVVDDQTLVRSLIVQVLKGLGFVQEHIHQAVDGMGALRSLNVRNIDVVLCDINMEPVCGLDLLKEVRMGRPHISASNLPFIFLSGHAERQNVQLAAQLHADGFIVKPPKPIDIEKALEVAFSRKRPDPAPFRYASVVTGTEYDRSYGFKLGDNGFELSHSQELPSAEEACLLPIQEVEADALLLADVASPTGHVLLRRGKRITAAQLRTLRNNIDIYGIKNLLVLDESTPE